MLSSDIYRDYEADYSAASGAEEVQLQVEEEGWKQREADEEEGSGKLFTSSRHAFACYPHPRLLRTPEVQRMAPLFRCFPSTSSSSNPTLFCSWRGWIFQFTSQLKELLSGKPLWISPSRQSFHPSFPGCKYAQDGFFPKLCLLSPNLSVCHIFPAPQLSPSPLLFTDVPLACPARENNLFLAPFCAWGCSCMCVLIGSLVNMCMPPVALILPDSWWWCCSANCAVVPTGKIVIAATAVTVTVAKKTAIAGGKPTLISCSATCISDLVAHPSPSQHPHSKGCEAAGFPYSWLFLSSFFPSVYPFEIWPFWPAFAGGIIANLLVTAVFFGLWHLLTDWKSWGL